MTPDQFEQVMVKIEQAMATFESAANSLRIIADAVEQAAQQLPIEEEG